MTTINMFKNHPQKKAIKFIVLPLAAELLRSTGDMPSDIYELMDKYAKGKQACCGINLD